MRRGKAPAADIPARLRSLAPEWAPYRSINGLGIRRYLDAEHGVKVATTGRRYPVDPGMIRDAIARPPPATRTGWDEHDTAQPPADVATGPRLVE